MVDVYCVCMTCDNQFIVHKPMNMEQIKCPECSSYSIIKRRCMVMNKSFKDIADTPSHDVHR